MRARDSLLRSFVAGLALVMLVAAGAAAGVEVQTSKSGVTYSIRVPQGYDAHEARLLVIGLHGQGGSHDRFMQVMLRAGYLGKAALVAPDALAGKAWGAADVGRVAELVREVAGRVRAHRTLLFGYSRGAYFAFGLGLEHPDIAQAVTRTSWS